MFQKILLFTIAALAAVRAAPASRSDSAITDADILQYALTLEHLENAFYAEALAKFDQGAFAGAGYSSDVRQRFVEIGEHEATHVKFLSDALGSDATKACNYSFPIPDPRSFASVAATLESVGVSAYAGAAHYIDNSDYLTAAATILSVEARHASWVNANANSSDPFPAPFDTPLSPSEVLKLAAPFIVECPSSNPKLPFDT
ncbi:hypothetical protein OH76DRAFT_1489029 [Lentinus brumalis]|uniref:Ferritin-like domain-containing protein n=1 Tax=Lentinus brumalis TaxID=2498619 RepID=A0A371CNW1_9APHY|nr:hypothetical protein OH76DRAFT_1489029 [Polyporus brumalis]